MAQQKKRITPQKGLRGPSGVTPDQLRAQMADKFSDGILMPIVEPLSELGVLGKDEDDDEDELDFDEVVTSFDPGTVQGGIEAGIRAAASEFVTSFNELIDDFLSREPMAGPFADKYRMRTDHQSALEAAFRQAVLPCYSSLQQLASARAAYLNFKSTSTVKAIGAGTTAGYVGAAIGSAIFPVVGTAIGGILGSVFAGSAIDEQAAGLRQDYANRLDALTATILPANEVLVKQVGERFDASFGTHLGRLGQEVERERERRRQNELQVAAKGNRQVSLEATNSHSVPSTENDGLAPQRVPLFRRWAVWVVILLLIGGGSVAAYRAMIGSSATPLPTAATASTKAIPTNLAIIHTGVQLRRGPANTFPIVTTLNKESPAIVLDESVPGWRKVRLGAESEGWVVTPVDGAEK